MNCHWRTAFVCSRPPAPSFARTWRIVGDRPKRKSNAAKPPPPKKTSRFLKKQASAPCGRKTVFTTPQRFPAGEFVQEEIADPDFREILEPRNCYICKQDYSKVHFFYDQLCPACAELNYRKRTESADLSGRVALLTGGRVKIGYQAGIKLLRAGAQLIMTTRFPRDAAVRFAEEPDYEDWGGPAGNLRARPAAHPQRGSLLPPSPGHADAARFHREQRLPNGAASAGFLSPHDGSGDRRPQEFARPGPTPPRCL